MPDFYLKSGGAAERANSTAYATGARIVPARADAGTNNAVAKRWVWEATTGGTSGATLPTWPASVTQDTTTVTDGTVTWTARTPGYSSGSTINWSFATIYMDYAASAMAAGDRLFVSSAHTESVAASVTVTFPGTLAAPNLAVCVAENGSNVPTVTATGASVTTTGSGQLTVRGAVATSGIRFSSGSGFVNANMALGTNGDDLMRFSNCTLEGNATGSGARLAIGATSNTRAGAYRFDNCDLRVANGFSAVNCRFVWNGGVLSSPVALTTVFPSGSSTSRGFTDIRLSGIDMSSLPQAVNFFAAAVGINTGLLRNCKLPASWTGGLVTGTMQPPERYEMHNCDSGDTNYRLWVEDYAGSIKHETTIVRTGGASDGTTSLSRRMTSSANAKYPLVPLESPEITKWNDVVGSSRTVTVEVITDGVTLNNDEAWLEVQYLSASGHPLGSFESDAKASVLAAAQPQDSSTATWTTTGLTTPTKQKLSVMFTPQKKGHIHAVVKLAKPSTTMYYCHKLDVT